MMKKLTDSLWNFLQTKVKPHFTKGGKFENLYYLYEAIETFLFLPPEVTHDKPGTHVRDGMNLKRLMIHVVFALIPPMLFGIWNIGHQHYLAIGEYTGLTEGFIDKFLVGLKVFLPILIVIMAVGGTIEVLFAIIRKHPVTEGFLVTGPLIALIMPPTIPLWMVAVATAFAVTFGKEIFGGTGMNVVNTALLARAFLFFAYPAHMSGDQVWIYLGDAADKLVDGFSGATPLAVAAEGGYQALKSFSYQSYGFWDMFFGWIPGSIGETSTLAILLGAGLLLHTGVADWRIMAGMLLGGIFAAILFNLFPANEYMALPWYYHLVMGGFAFGLVYMATDPVTSASTFTGKWIYGFLIGVVALIIRVLNPAYPEGVMLAILLGNVSAPLIDHLVIKSYINRRSRQVAALTADVQTPEQKPEKETSHA